MNVALWSETAVPSAGRPALSGDLTADVVIIGAGVGGLSTAYHLAASGVSVIVLEAHRVGSGAVGKSSGFLNAGLWVPPSAIHKAIGETYGQRLIELLSRAPGDTFKFISDLNLSCDAQRAGTLQCAPDEAGFQDLSERLSGLGTAGGALRLADAAETAQLTGTKIYRGAMIDSRAGVLQPLSYVRSLAAAAEVAGTRIFETSTATRFNHEASGWEVGTNAGSIRARAMLIATEANMIGAHFGLRAEYVPMPYFNAATRRLTAQEKAAVMPAGQPIVDLRKVVSSYRFDAHDRLVVGSVGELSGPDGLVNRDWIARKVTRLFPSLRGIPLEFAWTGIIGITDTHMPTIHRLSPNGYALGGYNGRGIAAGTVFGKLMAELFTGRLAEADLPVPVTAPQSARFTATRGKAFRAGAAAFHFLDARR